MSGRTGGSGTGAAARTARGFTLVEVLVALTIMAVLAGLSWRGVDAMLAARDHGQRRLDDMLRLSTVLTQWEQDMAALHETAAVPPLSFDGRTLRLTRAWPQGLSVVAWTVHDGAWSRWAGPIVTRTDALQQSWLASQQLLGDEAGFLRAIPGASDWQVFYWRDNAWTNAQSSGDLKPGAEGSPAQAAERELLPSGIRLVLALESGPLTRDIEVPPQPE